MVELAGARWLEEDLAVEQVGDQVGEIVGGRRRCDQQTRQRPQSRIVLHR